MTAFFTFGQPGYYLLILLFVGCIAALICTGRRRRKNSRADQLQDRYAVMTASLLEQTPDDQLVTAVAANLMGKLKSRRPDPLVTMPQQTRGRCAVYFSWLICKEIERNGPEALRRKPASRFTDIGAESLVTVGAEKTAAALRLFLTPPDTDPAEDGPAAARADALLAAIDEEQPLSLCVSYIRRVPEEFVDSEEEPSDR